MVVLSSSPSAVTPATASALSLPSTPSSASASASATTTTTPIAKSLTQSQSSLTSSKIEVPSVVAGAFAGAFAKTAVAPVERIKLLIQLQGSLDSAQYARRSSWQIARTIFQDQGVLSFWRGNAPNVIRQAGSAGLNFFFVDIYRDLANKTVGNKLWWRPFLSGGLAGATATTLLYPIEYLRTRLAMDIGSDMTREYTGMRDVLIKTIRSDGITGLYQGYGIALAGVFCYRAIHLGGYEVMKKEFSQQSSSSSSPSLGERFVVAQTVSLVAGTLCYPIDSVRRRMMMQSGLAPVERSYRNSLECIRVVLAREGIKGFYLGMGPNLVRSFGGALLLVSYDWAKGV